MSLKENKIKEIWKTSTLKTIIQWSRKSFPAWEYRELKDMPWKTSIVMSNELFMSTPKQAIVEKWELSFEDLWSAQECLNF